MPQKHIGCIDGLRAISCFGIIAMHIASNATYEITGYIYNRIIFSFGELVYLFFIISGFGMCCGYLKKFQNNEISLEKYYIRRYKKILPFFVLLIIITLIIEPVKSNFFESIIEMELVYGLLPNNTLSVVGVSWTIGVIFLFYLLFPFFCFLLNNRKRAWFSFILSCITSYLCEIYFFTDKFVIDGFVPRHNILYCAPFFLFGGIIYLYSDSIKKFMSTRLKCVGGGMVLLLCIALTFIYYVTPSYKVGNVSIFIIKHIILYGAWFIYAISAESKFLDNKVMRFLSNISMEMYLAQMVIFRMMEKIGALFIWGKGWSSFITVLLLEIAFLIIFVKLWEIIYEKGCCCISSKKCRKSD